MSSWLQLLAHEAGEWYLALLRAIPGELGCVLRRNLYGFHAGPQTRVLANVIVYYPRRLCLGRGVGIASGCQLNAAGGIDIGDHVLIGPGCFIWSQNHRFDRDGPIAPQGYSSKRVTIGRFAWLGAGVIVLPGVNVAEGTVVAAGAVVTRDTQPYTVVAGVPAQVIRRRAPQDCSTAFSGPVERHQGAARVLGRDDTRHEEVDDGARELEVPRG